MSKVNRAKSPLFFPLESLETRLDKFSNGLERLETRLKPRSSKFSRVENWVSSIELRETVNLHLNSTVISPTKYQTSERGKVKKIVLYIHFSFLFVFNKKHTLIASQRKQNSTSTPLPPKTNSSSSFFTCKRSSVL